jgi:hypothetical protein
MWTLKINITLIGIKTLVCYTLLFSDSNFIALALKLDIRIYRLMVVVIISLIKPRGSARFKVL